jgi:hypothetical protein
LDSVIATGELHRRPARDPDTAGETRVLLNLTHALAREPEGFFQQLVAGAKTLTRAASAGISLLNEGARRFVWPAVTGGLAPYVGAGTPSDFGPCGTVLERRSPLLFQHPERHFTYLAPITPPLEEVLLAPFSVHGKPVGTVWAVLHTEGSLFDAEDLRLLESLTSFAASAYELFLSNGTLLPMMACEQ